MHLIKASESHPDSIIHRHPLVVRRSHPHERVSNFNFAIAWLERDKKSLIAVIARNYRAKVIDVFHEIGKQASRSSPLSGEALRILKSLI